MRRLKSLAHFAPRRYRGTPSLAPNSRTETTRKPAKRTTTEQKPAKVSRVESEAETLGETNHTSDDDDDDDGKSSSQASKACFKDDSGYDDGKGGSEDDELEDDFDNLYRVTDFVDDLASVTSDDGSYEEGKEDGDLPEDFYNVERILDRRGRGTYKEYLVKWEGFSSDENSWVPMDDFADPQMTRDYERHRKKRLEKKPLHGLFVVEAILSHRDDRGIREYLVEWEGYPVSENSWVEEEDFKNKKIVDKYKKHINVDHTDEQL
jgi:hypothetical protein